MSRAVFVALVLAVALQRLIELAVSRRNVRALLRRGAREARNDLPAMALVHGAWLVAAPLEVLVLARPLVAALAVPAAALFLAGQALRFSAIWTLGPRWTARVVTVPGEAPVARGPYRFLRHPNYLGIILEIVSLPLIHGAWITAVLASAANGALLVRRIRIEERALAADQDYEAALGARPRLVPLPGRGTRAINPRG
ncbi:MAG: hypothetical protein KBD01_02530 [Acidobacteria bacterium]|nr:hypothetical protein [Acidobacteriota bacterium]